METAPKTDANAGNYTNKDEESKILEELWEEADDKLLETLKTEKSQKDQC